MASDVVGYSALMGRDEAGTLSAIRSLRKELWGPKIDEYGGRVVKTTGDGQLTEFASVADAVQCAAEVQRAMRRRNADIPEDHRIALRVGINQGDVIVDGDDIYGDGVNVAARLEEAAEPGGICISRAVRDQIRDKLLYELEDLGEQDLKNIARPVRVFRVSIEETGDTVGDRSQLCTGTCGIGEVGGHRLDVRFRRVCVASGRNKGVGNPGGHPRPRRCRGEPRGRLGVLLRQANGPV